MPLQMLLELSNLGMLYSKCKIKKLKIISLFISVIRWIYKETDTAVLSLIIQYNSNYKCKK